MILGRRFQTSLIIAFCFLLGCSSLGETGDGLSIIIAPQHPFYSRGKAALIFDALLPQPSPQLAAESTIIFQKALLRHRVFKVIQRFCAQPKKSEPTMMALAREKGFDFMVRGKVTDFFLPRELKHLGLRFPLRFIT